MCSKEFQAELREIIRSKRGNELCVDCKEPNPTWASVNLGVFMCLDCSGIHRAMGVHISFVKSLSLDKWTPQLIANMRNGGNERANAYFEAKMPPNYPRPRTMQERETFIRDKYQHRKWVGKPSEASATAQAEENEDAHQQETSNSTGGRKKRIPPSQRRAMQQQQQQSSSENRSDPVDAVNLLGVEEPAPKSSGGNLFQNMNIKVKTSEIVEQETPKPASPPNMMGDLLLSLDEPSTNGGGHNVLGNFGLGAPQPPVQQQPRPSEPLDILSQFGMMSMGNTNRDDDDSLKKLGEIETELSQAQQQVQNATMVLQSFLQIKQELVKAKLNLEQLNGRVDSLQMQELDSILGTSQEVLESRKKLNARATNLASQILLVHRNLTNALN